jgi:3-methyladenine DNA glycosylase AlkD
MSMSRGASLPRKWTAGANFDNWGICDTVCFALFDRTPHAWAKVTQWSNQREEFVKRAAFALLWGLTVHDKAANDEQFVQGLLFIERAAGDERHFVKKAVNMALRAIGKRNPALNVAAVAVAQRSRNHLRPLRDGLARTRSGSLRVPGDPTARGVTSLRLDNEEQ